MEWPTVVGILAIIGLILLFVWLFKWRDPDWTEEDQQRSRLWSKRTRSGR